MKFWVAKQSSISIREQLATQIKLAITSGDLHPGAKLATVRQAARQYRIHANTASATYRSLEADGWLERRNGSGIYVLSRTAIQTGPLPPDAARLFAPAPDRPVIQPIPEPVSTWQAGRHPVKICMPAGSH